MVSNPAEMTELDFVLRLTELLPAMKPAQEDIGKVSPKGRSELKTRDRAQITAWYEAGENLVVHGISLRRRAGR